MTKSHDFLKYEAKHLLLEKGFNEKEIVEECNFNFESVSGRIDVAGVHKGKIEIAIECGQCPTKKIALLKRNVPFVIHLPYCLTDKSENPFFSESAFKELKLLKEKNNILEADLLYQKKKILALLSVLKALCWYRNNTAMAELKEMRTALQEKFLEIDKNIVNLLTFQVFDFEKLKAATEEEWLVFRESQYASQDILKEIISATKKVEYTDLDLTKSEQIQISK